MAYCNMLFQYSVLRVRKKAILLSRLPLFTKAGIPKVNLTYCKHTSSCLKILSPSPLQQISPYRRGNHISEAIYTSSFSLFNVPLSFGFIINAIQLAFTRVYPNLIINIPDPIPQIILICFGWLFKKKIVIWHASPTPPLDKILMPLLFPSFFIANKVIFFTSSHIKSLLKSNPYLSFFSHKFQVIPFGIFDSVSSNPVKFFPTDTINIISVGRLVEYKGFINLIQSITYLPSHYILKIVGDGPLRSHLLSTIDELGLNQRVELITNADDSMLSDLYRSSDIYVMSSISQAEAYGISQLEAMSYSLPIINTPLNNGVNELAPNGITGFCTKGFDAKSISEAILLINLDNYSFFSTNCLQRSSSIYSSSNFANTIDLLLS